ncbi:MAG TPA: T9SS type A sorting domain-containing protein [Ignavibacteria bacterium]|jgi:hypothetical protein
MFNNFKKSLQIVILTAMLIGQTYSQFFKSYDFAPFTTRTEIGYSLERTSLALSSGWSIAGVTNATPSAGDYDWLFIKLNSSGTVICKTTLGFSLGDSAFSHVQLTNGRTVVAGFYRAANLREKASWSIIDTNCMHVISKQIMDSLQHQYRGVTKNPVDEFTITGYINHFNSPGDYKNRILAAQYTPAGALLWAYKYFPPYPWVDERAYSIVYQPTDGTYGITGVTNRFTGPAGPYQVFIMKISAAGIPIWFKGYSPVPGGPSEARKIIAMPDGGFVVTGHTNVFDMAFNDYYVIRVTPMGIPMWQNVYGVPEFKEQSYSIVYQPSDMSLVFTGLRQAPASTEDVAMVKITVAAGMIVWTKVFPNTSGHDRGYDIELASPSGYGVTGQLFHSSSATLDPFLLRSDAFGNVTPSCQDSIILQPRPGQWTGDCTRQPYQLIDIQCQPQVNNPQHVERIQCGTPTGINGSNNQLPDEFSLNQNYPNPFNPSTKISYNIKTSGNVKLSVYNSAGELVKELVNNNQEQGSYEVTFDAASFSSGIYFYTLKTEEFTDTKKMVLIK